MPLPPYVVGPAVGYSHTHTVILLHGLGSNAKEFASEFFESEASGTEIDRTLPALFPTIKWVFPQARWRVVRSEQFGDRAAWFEMTSTDDPQENGSLQMPGLRSSFYYLTSEIKNEEKSVPRSRIFLGGISQGFATALNVFFVDGNGGFAGVCGFCSWLPLVSAITSKEPQELSRGLTTTPIFLEHSRDDSIICIKNGIRMRDTLKELGFGVEWKEYEDGDHWINEPQGVDDFAGFLQRAMR